MDLPPLYSWPPFFTLQPQEATRDQQLEQWARLLVSWCAFHRQALLPVLREWPLWRNAALDRALPPDGITAVAERLVARKQAEWSDGAHSGLRVFWKSPAEWASIICAHIAAAGYGGQLLTVYELHSGSAGLGSPVHGLEAATLMKALEVCAAQGKAQLLPADSIDEVAVRFSG